jgi:threonine/homoserine/homoserine lactone efflux protein
MASVDFSYAALVFTFGSAIVESLNDWVWPMRIGGSAILVLVAIKIFIDARKSSRIENPNIDNPTTTPLKTYAKFFGLTVLNPATAFYFVGITPSVALIDNSPNSAGVFLFAIGVFIGSVVWQMSLVFAAQLTSKFTDEKIQHRIQYLGSILIFALAVGLLAK